MVFDLFSIPTTTTTTMRCAMHKRLQSLLFAHAWHSMPFRTISHANADAEADAAWCAARTIRAIFQHIRCLKCNSCVFRRLRALQCLRCGRETPAGVRMTNAISNDSRHSRVRLVRANTAKRLTLLIRLTMRSQKPCDIIRPYECIYYFHLHEKCMYYSNGSAWTGKRHYPMNRHFVEICFV